MTTAMWVTALVAAIGFGAVALVRRVTEAGARDARDAAVRWGLEPREVERPMPVSRDRGRSWQVEPRACVRYSMAVTGGTGSRWTLLQRPEEHHPPLPPGWRLDSDDGGPAPGVEAALREIAESREEEFFELEADGSRVHAFWEETGGRPGARRVRERLRTVASAVEEHRG